MKKYRQYMGTILQKKQKKEIVLLVFMMTVSAVLEVFSVSSVIPVISAMVDRDFYKANRYAAAVCRWLRISSYDRFVILCVGVLVLSFVAKNLFLIFKNRYHAKFSLRFQHDLRVRMLDLYFGKDYEYFVNTNSTEIIKTLFDDIARCYASFDGMLNILASLIVTFFLGITVFVIQWKLSLGILLVLLAVFSVISLVVRPIARRSGTVAHAAVLRRNRWIRQGISGIKTVKATESCDYFADQARLADEEYLKEEEKVSVVSKIPRNLIEMTSIIAILTLIMVSVLRGNELSALLPSLGAMGLAVLRILPAVSSLLTTVTSIQYWMPSIEKVAALVQEERTAEEEGPFPDRYEKSIRCRGVSFSYDGSDRRILDRLELEIPVGSMVGIVGTSGEGKTTLVDIMLGLLKPREGAVEADGTDIRRNIKKWKRSIGYITQNTFLLDDSIIANVAFGIPEAEADIDRVWTALEKAQIADFVRELPEGIRTRIGERGVKLSGGQCQRLGIARALYAGPQILIFDEATSSLDSQTESAVVEAINGLYGEQTILVIAHRSKALEKCDVLFRMENGKVRIEEKSKVLS